MVPYVFAVIASCLALVGAQQYSFLDSTISGFMKDENLPGCSLVVNNGGNKIYSKGYGVADKATMAKIDPEVSLLRIGSVSKTFTAAAIMLLVEANKINLNHQVFGPFGLLNQYQIPFNHDWRLSQITVTNLLQHTSGWDRMTSGDPLDNSNGLYSNIARQMGVYTPFNNHVLINWLLRQRLDFSPGTRHAYSNVGFMLLGEIITKYSGKSYEEYIKDMVAGIGITDMKLGKTRESERATNEVKYYFNPENKRVMSIFFQDGWVSPCYGAMPLENAASAASWIASMRDLVKFIHSLDGTGGQHLFRHSTSFATMKARPSYEKSDAKKWYGMGLTVEKTGLKYGHNGLVPGAIATMSHDFTGYNFALTCNGLPGDIDTDSVVRYALSLEKVLTPNYNPVRHNGFDSVSLNGNYAVNIMVKEEDLVSVVSSQRKEGFRLLFIESFQVSGTGLPAFTSPLAQQFDFLGYPQQRSLAKEVYFTLTWKKDSKTSWNLEHGLTLNSANMRISNLKQFYPQTMVKYLTAYPDASGQIRHTLITGPADNTRWNVLIGVPFQNQPYQNRLMVGQGLQMVTQDVHNYNGGTFVSSLFTSNAQYVANVQAGLQPPSYIDMMDQGNTPVHLQVTQELRSGKPLFNAIFTTGLESQVHSQLTQYKLRMTLLDAALDGWMPVTIAGFEMMGNILFEAILIKEI